MPFEQLVQTIHGVIPKMFVVYGVELEFLNQGYQPMGLTHKDSIWPHQTNDFRKEIVHVVRVGEHVHLNGEVRDETRSVMTPQTIEHCRQSIREFQYKHSA